jgi:hypothetical protein
MKGFLFVVILNSCIFLSVKLNGQVAGCTDPQANNLNSLATLNNGSCLYNPVNYSPTGAVILPSALVELSGMIYWNGLFWGHNDGGNGAWIYAFDTLSGIIRKTIGLPSATNIDWEDIAQDDLHIYIGDFGNNANGNRTNLCIYKIPKAHLLASGDTLLLQPGQFERINYSYPDQFNFSPTGANRTRFDCEAFFFHREKLHLITKNWLGDYSVHYSIPLLPGTWVANRHDSLFTGGFLITGADVGAEDEILLTAYNSSGSGAFFLIYGFDSSVHFFNTGNKRRINLPSAIGIGQLEAICFINGIRGAIGSERFQVSVITVNQNMRRFTTSQWITGHYERNSPQFAEPGMIRYNNELNAFEYFNGSVWLTL